MNENLIALASVVSIGMIVIYVFWLYRDFNVDSYRQQMFTLRDEFFDEAANGRIDFQAPAYGMLRSTMNGLIRYGHRLSIPQMFFVSHAIGQHSKGTDIDSFSDRLDEHLNALDEEQRELCMKYYMHMNIVLVRHLLLSSPLLLISIVVPLVISVTANLAVKKAVGFLSQPIDKLDSLALAEGETNTC